MPDSKKRDRPIEPLDDNGIKKPKVNDGGSNSVADRIAAAKARIAALNKKKEAGNGTGTAGTAGSTGTTPTPTPTTTATKSTAADLMAKIRERKAQLELLNKKKEEERKEESDLKPSSVRTSLPREVPVKETPLQSTSRAPIRASQQPPPPPPPKRGLGLNTPVHPLLLETKPIKPIETKPNIYLSHENEINNQNQLPTSLSPSTSTTTTPIATPTPTTPFNPYLDNQLSIKSNFNHRRSRGLAFNPQGKFIKQAEEERKQIQLEILKKKIEQTKSKASNILDADILAGERLFKPSPPPSIEWWDEAVLNEPSQGYSNTTISHDSITIYIQHPIPIPAPWEKSLPKQTKLHLTKKEIKRMRKNDRAERHKEAQDRIRLGLDPAPPPKIKPSNVMSVFTNEAIKDPTLMELRAKTEVQQRKEKHEQDNQTRKLTSEQKYQKWVEKSEREKSKGIYSAAFRIENLSDGKHKFLINYNAKHLQLTGMTIFNQKFNLIIVEGGFLNIKKFSKLLLNRIKWTENAPPRPTEDTNSPPPPPPDLSSNKCTLVWYGQIKSNKFLKWSLHDTETEQDSKDLLARHTCEHFWIEARSLNPS